MHSDAIKLQRREPHLKECHESFADVLLVLGGQVSQDSHHRRHLGDLLPGPLVPVCGISPGTAEILQATVQHAGDYGGREAGTAEARADMHVFKAEDGMQQSSSHYEPVNEL